MAKRSRGATSVPPVSWDDHGARGQELVRAERGEQTTDHHAITVYLL